MNLLYIHLLVLAFTFLFTYLYLPCDFVSCKTVWTRSNGQRIASVQPAKVAATASVAPTTENGNALFYIQPNCNIDIIFIHEVVLH